MARHVWGLDIGKWSLKAVKARPGRGSEPKMVVETVDVINYSELACGLQAEDAEKVQEAIRVFRERNEIAKSDRIMVGIPGQEVFSRFINLPPVPKKKIPEIVRYEAQQQIPFDIDSVVWDYQPIRRELVEGEEIEIGLFAIKNERVEDVLLNLQPLRMNLMGIQVSPLALFNFAEYEGYGEAPLIVLDLGAQTTDLVVIDPPRFWLRPILVGGNNLTVALQQKFNVSFEEAETVKFRAPEAKHARQVFEVMRPVIRNLTSEVQRSLGFYKSLFQEVKFEKILTVGNSFKMKGLDKFLAESLLYDVQVLSEVRNIGLGTSVDAEAFQNNIVGLGVALGLCTQGLGIARVNINLLPKRYTTEVQLVRKKPWVAAAVAMSYVIVLSLFISEKSVARQLASVADKGGETIKEDEEWNRKYATAKSNLSNAEAPIKGLTALGRRRDIWIQTLTRLIQDWKKQKSTFYIRKLETYYLTKDNIDELGVTPAPEQPAEEGKPVEAAPIALVDGPHICLDIEVECTEIRESVVDELISNLRAIKLPEEKVPLFARIGRVGGELRTEVVKIGDSERRHLVFSVRCVVMDDEEIRQEMSKLLESKELDSNKTEAPAKEAEGGQPVVEPGK
ncbi:MAG TPA: pilus assembly protein PilM [Candidatus Brocadiia bacterium]|nr:pilus assembly protein PilM [Candidatus Brocadiia bacterium]